MLKIWKADAIHLITILVKTEKCVYSDENMLSICSY